MNHVVDLLKSHRSIRKFKEKPIPEEMLTEIIESAQWASSSSFVQAYSIIGIKEMEKKKKLATISGEQQYVADCPVFLVFCADLHRLDQCCSIHGTQMVGEYTESFIMATVDAAIAAQNAMIAAESFGLGGVYIGGIRNNPEEVCELLALPHYVYPVFGMCLGYPNQDPEVKPRLPLSVVYMEETYGSMDQDQKLVEYDQEISEYYFQRTRGKRRDTWTKQMAEKMQMETRPHMKDFLVKRGFILK